MQRVRLTRRLPHVYFWSSVNQCSIKAVAYLDKARERTHLWCGATSSAIKLFGGPMITVSDKALAELEAYFTGKDKTPIRIHLAPGG